MWGISIAISADSACTICGKSFIHGNMNRHRLPS